VTDQEGLVLGVLTTKASTNEIANLEDVLDTADLPEGIPLKADKGYQSKNNGKILEKRKLKNHILKKAKKNHPLTIQVYRINLQKYVLFKFRDALSTFVFVETPSVLKISCFV
jgi:IS5 family transposase